jgi:hypothetical protein
MSYDDWKQLIRVVAAQDVRTPAYYWEQAKRADEQFPELMQTTIETVIRERKESAKIEKPAKLNSLPTEEREGLPLKITVSVILPVEDRFAPKCFAVVVFGIGRSNVI